MLKIGNYIGTWKCVAEISGDTGIAINENFNLNEVLSRKEDWRQKLSQTQQKQLDSSGQDASSPSPPKVNFSQGGVLNKDKVAVWH